MHHAPYFSRTAAATAASLACALAALPAAAQQTQAITDEGLNKVIVTAQKREQAALDVPASVTAVNTDQLARDGKVRLEDYAAQVPGMSLSSFRQGFTQVALRGITTGVAQSASTTAFYVDEAPIGSVNAYAAGSAVTPDIDPADLQRVEILKGPQGTLYGAGAMGGLVRYVTAAPDYRKLRGSVTLGGNAVKGGAMARSVAPRSISRWARTIWRCGYRCSAAPTPVISTRPMAARTSTNRRSRAAASPSTG